jgi:tripartite-type tricarboxylate transporter receptor subunit TctC
MSRSLVGFAAVLLAGAIALAPAPSYPQRAVRFILPFGPASGVDTIKEMRDQLASIAQTLGVKAAQ